MKVMTNTNLKLQAVLLAARIKQDICRDFTVKVVRVFMWTYSFNVLQRLNSTTRHSIIIANRDSEILEHTSDVEWNQVSSSENPTDAGTRSMSAEVLQSRSG